MSQNSPFSPPEGWVSHPENDARWISAVKAEQGDAQIVFLRARYYASVDSPIRSTREEAEKDRLAMVQAMAPTPPELTVALDRLGTQPGPLLARLKEGFAMLQAQVGRLAVEKMEAVKQASRAEAELENARILAIEMALDEVKAPASENLVERIRGLGQRIENGKDSFNVLHEDYSALLRDVRQALNIGPPSDSDVKPSTLPNRLVEIVRKRSELMLEERDQRVALAKEVQRLEKQLKDERNRAIERLMLWMSGDQCDVASELLDQVARAVEEGTVTADDANDARRSRRALAVLVLNVDFPGDSIPF